MFLTEKPWIFQVKFPRKIHLADPAARPTLHKVMTQCFNRDVDARPDFKAIVSLLNVLVPREFNEILPSSSATKEVSYNTMPGPNEVRNTQTYANQDGARALPPVPPRPVGGNYGHI